MSSHDLITNEAPDAALRTSELGSRIRDIQLEVRKNFRPAQGEDGLLGVVADAKGHDDPALATAYLELAALARYQQKLTAARVHAVAALQRYSRDGHHAGQARGHVELAEIDLAGGRDPGIELERARQAMPQGCRDIEASIAFVRSQVPLHQGRFGEAGCLLKEAIGALEDAGTEFSYHLARYQGLLGMVERVRGARIAGEHLMSAYELADAGKFLRVKALCLLDFGQIALDREDLASATLLLKEASALFVTVEDELGRGHTLSALGELRRRQRHLPQAIEILEWARDICTTRGHFPGEVLARSRLAKAYIDYLREREAWGQPLSRQMYDRADAEVSMAARQFDHFASSTATALTPDTTWSMLHLTNEAPPLKPTSADELFGKLRPQFRANRCGHRLLEDSEPPIAPSALLTPAPPTHAAYAA